MTILMKNVSTLFYFYLFIFFFFFFLVNQMKLLPLLGHFAPGYLQTENFGKIWMVFEQIWVKFWQSFSKIWVKVQAKATGLRMLLYILLVEMLTEFWQDWQEKKKCPDKSPQIPSHWASFGKTGEKIYTV